MGEVVFRKVQYGKETTRGTAVAATAMWPGEIVVPQDRTLTASPIKTGRRTERVKGTFNQYLVDGFQLRTNQMMFEKLPLLFSMLLKGGVTATETTPSQADYLWAFGPSLTASNALNAFTMEWGDDTEQYEMEYALLRKLNLKWAAGDAAGVDVSAEGFARQISDSSFTSALTPGTLTPMVANLAKVYIDPTWATLGSTLKTNLVRSVDLELTNGAHPKFMMDGMRYFSTHGEGYLNAMLTMELEGNTDADTEWDNFRAETARAIRLLIEGPQIGTGVVNKLQIDLFGYWEVMKPLEGEKDGNNISIGIFSNYDDNQATPHTIDVNVVCDSNAV